MNPTAPRVGMFLPDGVVESGPDAARRMLGRIADAGIDHVGCFDHVSFRDGSGFDGLIHATALAVLEPRLPVFIGVYLLPLRHPVLVARQLADIARIAPGRLVLGVGVGGEDRHEVEMTGVDPSTRGRRMNESLDVLRRLLDGGPVTHAGEFFELEDAVIAPTPSEPIPIVVGGRSDAAIERAGRLGDGWLGIWCSTRRFGEAVELAARAAAEAGRPAPSRHAMEFWCGFGASREAARARLAPSMEAFYGLPFEQFERYCPYGTPEEVAAFIAPYVEAGAVDINLIPRAADDDAAIAGVAEVRRLLAG